MHKMCQSTFPILLTVSFSFRFSGGWKLCRKLRTKAKGLNYKQTLAEQLLHRNPFLLKSANISTSNLYS